MRPPPKFVAVVATWFAAALVAGGSGILLSLRPPAPQLLVFALTALVLVAAKRAGELRDWTLAVDPRALVALHLTRFVGIAFLVLQRRGELPGEFAVKAGIGDIVTAAFAGALLLTGSLTTPNRRRLAQAWNVFGLADILMVVAGAARFGIADSASMAPLLRLPLCLLPTFLVPLLIASHVVLFERLKSPHPNEARSSPAPTPKGPRE